VDLLDWLATESDAFAATLRPDSLARAVPSCPGWTLLDLGWHVGRVQRFWAMVATNGDTQPAFPPEEPGPSDPGDLVAWVRAGSAELLDAVSSTSFDAPAWAWWVEDRTVGAIARHQVQEAAVHRWDAQSAVGAAAPLPAALADDGVDEFLWISRQLRGPVPLEADATDTGHSYNAGADARVVVRATASDLVLLFYQRIAPTAPRVEIDGDRAVLDAWLQPIA
jgi:uncharacterized protein (TIGR03083 family)